MQKPLLEVIQLSSNYLAQKGVEPARREAEELISNVLKMRRLDLYLQFDRPLIENELQEIRLAIQKRGKRVPSAYIFGQVCFFDCLFKLTPAVLIPRPETEILVDLISQTLKDQPLDGKVLWDVCCGSGCIGISLKKRFPALTVFLSDLSREALLVAKQNAILNEVEIEFLQGDLLEPFSSQKCDFFVSNPPYVSQEEYSSLSAEVQLEPKSALVSGPSGLEFYERLAHDLKGHLNPEGKGWMEIGSGQGKKVQEIFKKEAWSCRYSQDWSQHDRFFFLETDR